MAAYPFSAFRRYQHIFELRYDTAYLLWDRAGAVSAQIGRLFKTFKNTSASPGQVMFNADDRFILAVMLDKASITDHRPQGTPESMFDTFAAFADVVIGTLDIQSFTRVGARHLYAIECKSRNEAYERAQSAVPNAVPEKDLFSLNPSSVYPTFKIEADDGELGYNVQLYAREQRLDFMPPPDALAVGLTQYEKDQFQLILDFDLYTKHLIARESFDAKTWLAAWYKSVTRDADAFLDLAGGPS